MIKEGSVLRHEFVRQILAPKHKHFFRYFGRVFYKGSWWEVLAFQCDKCPEMKYVKRNDLWPNTMQNPDA